MEALCGGVTESGNPVQEAELGTCRETGRRLFSVCEETGLRLHLEGLDGGHLHQVSMGAKQGQLVACVNMVLQLAYPPFFPIRAGGGCKTRPNSWVENGLGLPGLGTLGGKA